MEADPPGYILQEEAHQITSHYIAHTCPHLDATLGRRWTTEALPNSLPAKTSISGRLGHRCTPAPKPGTQHIG